MLNLRKRVLPGHLRVPRETAAMAERDEVLGDQRPAPVVGEGEGRIRVAACAEPERLVERREGCVDDRDGVAGREHEAVAEGQPRTAEVPAHRAGQHRRRAADGPWSAIRPGGRSGGS